MLKEKRSPSQTRKLGSHPATPGCLLLALKGQFTLSPGGEAKGVVL